MERSAETAPFRWDSLGLGEDGLPTHLPMPVTRDGQGPADADEAHRVVCWCGQDCPLNRSMDEAWRLGRSTNSPGQPP